MNSQQQNLQLLIQNALLVQQLQKMNIDTQLLVQQLQRMNTDTQQVILDLKSQILMPHEIDKLIEAKLKIKMDAFNAAQTSAIKHLKKLREE